MENVKHRSHPYKGEELDRKLKEFNLTRNPDEDDWSFRRRVFLTLFRKDHELAFVFLMGGPRSEWNKIDALFYSFIAHALFNDPKFQSGEAIERVVDRIPNDPLVARERRATPPPPHVHI